MRELPPFERDEVNVTLARKNGQSGLTAWVAILPCLRRFAFEWLSSPLLRPLIICSTAKSSQNSAVSNGSQRQGNDEKACVGQSCQFMLLVLEGEKNATITLAAIS